MDITYPKVTIVTVVRNGEKVIEKTIKSVINQNYPNLEYIVVDGDSQDDTKSIILKYSQYISKYISEPDSGIYDAMNKAAKLASGVWINYMNAGDYFYANDSLSSLTEALNSDADVIFAGVKEVLVDDLETRYFHKMPRPIVEIWRYMPICHQATMVRLSCQQEYGFNTSYIWCADHDMLARMYRDSKKFVSQDVLFCVFDCSGGSTREIMLYIKERWKLSKGLVPLYTRLIQYGGEWISCNIWGKLISIIKSFLPTSTIIKLRRLRGTAGI
ncbi:glycosyltransferase [Nostoc parmelioides FACHB-3921]|uniref:Glycosyltransferase n=2 Tax=Nostoc TaxID=1177 RepID=A0ABR8BMQ8_9NOSO|nr:glycosyltransferase [Nostoc parmelioides FACHB-3921]